MEDSALISGDHRAQLFSDLLHAFVVLTVVMCTTTLAAFDPKAIPQDVIGTVFGGALGYAAGRAGQVTRSRYK